MTRKKMQNKINSNTKRTAVLMLVCGVIAFALGWLGYSYRYTVYGMEQCKADGRSNCHIEWDGFEAGFSVYGE